MPGQPRDHSNPVDVSVKALFRQHPQALLKLINSPAAAVATRWEDPTITLPEMRADHVLIIRENGREGAVYIEYVLNADSRSHTGWMLKIAGLSARLKMPVAMLVVYLRRGQRSSFPDSFAVSVGGVSTELRFTAERLWEHRAAIESGELWELAPLLILCDEEPSEATVRKEIALIRNSGAPNPEQANQIAMAMRLAAS